MTQVEAHKRFVEILRALTRLALDVGAAIDAQQPKPKSSPQTAGNVVALPGVNLETAGRAQRRSRKRALTAD